MVHVDQLGLLGALSHGHVLVEVAALCAWDILGLNHDLILDDLLLLYRVYQVVLLQIRLTVRVLRTHQSERLCHSIGMRLKVLHIFEVNMMIVMAWPSRILAAAGSVAMSIDRPQIAVLSRSARGQRGRVLLLERLLGNLLCHLCVLMHH